MQIEAFFDDTTSTLTYIVYDPKSHDAVVIDPVLDYDPLASQTSTESVDGVMRFIDDHSLKLHRVLETHAHADHLSGSQLLKRRYGAGVVIGEKITEVQKVFKELFDLSDDFPVDGSQFDRLVADGETFTAGTLSFEVIATPGHTPACVSYLVGGTVFTGDALFMEDYGTGRCDFPRGSADTLYTSVHDRLYSLPDETRVFVGHDYLPSGRALRYESSIGREKAKNIQLNAETTREQFVKLRQKRDATLKAPRLIYQSVQTNVNAGRLPQPHANGKRYFNLPLNLRQPTDDIGASLEEGIRKTAE